MRSIRAGTSAALGALLLLGLGSCRTKLMVSDITHADCQQEIDGIPFRVRETHTVRVYQWKPATVRITTTKGPDGEPKEVKEVVTEAHFEEVMRKEVAFPNQHRLFALNFRSEQFSDHSLDLNYFPDNTIRSMTLSGTPNSEGFTSLAGAATAIPGKILSMDQDIATRAKALRDQDATRRTDRTTRLTDVLTFQAKQDALRKICQDWKAWEDAEAKKDPPSKPDVYGPEHVRLEGLAQTALKDLILAGVKIDQPVYDGNPFKLAVESIYKLFGGGSP